MAAKTFVPDLGDLVWLTPATHGRDSRGKRAGLVLSPRNYNAKTGTALACPITAAVKGYPFEVQLPLGGIVTGAVLADRVRSLNWRDEGAAFAAKAPDEVIAEVQERLRALLRL